MLEKQELTEEVHMPRVVGTARIAEEECTAAAQELGSRMFRVVAAAVERGLGIRGRGQASISYRSDEVSF